MKSTSMTAEYLQALLHKTSAPLASTHHRIDSYQDYQFSNSHLNTQFLLSSLLHFAQKVTILPFRVMLKARYSSRF